MTYQVKKLTEDRREAWDQFVLASSAATFFHLSGWKMVLETSFGHRSYSQYVERDQQICGILPLFQIKSWLFGNRLTSTPFCVAGASVSDSDEIDCLLDQKAIKL